MLACSLPLFFLWPPFPDPQNRPDQPILYKRFENEFGSFAFYNYQDNYDNVQYVSLYIILKNKPEDNKGFLYQYVHSAAMSWNGNVVKFEQSKQDGNDEILYVAETIKADELVYEFGVVAIKDGIVFQWVVEERNDMVKADSLFGEKVKYFKVLK